MKKDYCLFLIYGILGCFGLAVYIFILKAFYVCAAALFLIAASATHFKKYKTQIIKKHKPRRVKLLD